MSVPASQPDAAHAAFCRGDWRAAQQQLLEAGRVRSLVPAELELLSRATWLLGEVPESMQESEQAYVGYLRDGAPVAAAALGIRLGLEWTLRGDLAVASGWISRARRLLRDQPPSPTSGYLDYLEASTALTVTESDEGLALAESATGRLEELAEQFGDPTLSCFALVVRGLAAIQKGETTAGFERFDEAMLPVVAGQLDPLWAGDIYCTVIHFSGALGDLTRMRAWTDALARWARPLSELFMYALVTRVHQLQLIAAEGGWDVVEAELAARSADLVDAHGWLAGLGFVELGDVRRRRGDVVGAGEAYRRARDVGVDPQPGEAELLSASGRPDEALAGLRVSIGGSSRLDRARMLTVAVELALDTGDRGLAGAFAAEIDELAAYFGTSGLRARANQARAALALADGRPADALPLLHAAAQVFRDQRFKYAIARVHEQLGAAHRALGEDPPARAEFATAQAMYRELGAALDLDRVAARAESDGRPGGLTARESEVLVGVASGLSNRQVAERLFISDKTVGRHLANIFGKLGVSTRTAAAAWAHEHGLAATPPAGTLSHRSP